MYEAIVISKILMQVLSPQAAYRYNAVMYYYFPSPDTNKTLLYNI